MGIGGGGSRKFCQGWRYGGLLFSQPSTYFTEGRTNLPPEAIGPLGSNCFLRGVRTYSHL